MAHDRRWYKRNPGDFLMGTLGLDLETRGAYSIFIDMLNERDRPLPDDERFVAGVMGVSTRKWRVLRETLIRAGKIVVLPDGCLSNPRFERERAERDAEHRAAVEAGRQGGRRSAEARAAAAGQGELGLGSDAKTARTEAENGAKTRRNDDENAIVLPENNNLAEPPPQPSRARQRSDIRIDTPTTPNPPSPARAHTPAREDDDRLEAVAAQPEDLLGLTNRLGRLAGLNLTQPAHLARAVDQLREWLRDGIAAETIEQVITFKVQNAPPGDGSYSLRRFDAAIRGQHAKSLGRKPGDKPPPPPPVARFTFDDEDPRFEPIRRAIAERLNPRIYALWMNEIRLDAHERTIRLRGGRFQADYVRTNMADMMLQAARPFGFERVE